METNELVLSALERIEKRLDKQEEKMDSMIETVNAMKVNAAGCNAHFEEVDRQIETLESAGDKRRESTGTIVGIVSGVTALVGTLVGWIWSLVKSA